MFKDLDFILNNLEGLNKKIFFLFILTIFGTILETLSIGLIFPLLKISTSSDAKIFRKKLNAAISGLPQGPYTVNKRTPVKGIPCR